MKDIPFSERKLTATRPAHAAALFTVLRDHDLSARRAADLIEVNERQLWKYLKGSVPIPTTVFDAFPSGVADDFAMRLGIGGRHTVEGQLKAAIERAVREGMSKEVLLLAYARLADVKPKGHP